MTLSLSCLVTLGLNSVICLRNRHLKKKKKLKSAKARKKNKPAHTIREGNMEIKKVNCAYNETGVGGFFV